MPSSLEKRTLDGTLHPMSESTVGFGESALRRWTAVLLLALSLLPAAAFLIVLTDYKMARVDFMLPIVGLVIMFLPGGLWSLFKSARRRAA